MGIYYKNRRMVATNLQVFFFAFLRIFWIRNDHNLACSASCSNSRPNTALSHYDLRLCFSNIFELTTSQKILGAANNKIVC